jgi:hypothetical protein
MLEIKSEIYKLQILEINSEIYKLQILEVNSEIYILQILEINSEISEEKPTVKTKNFISIDNKMFTHMRK